MKTILKIIKFCLKNRTRIWMFFSVSFYFVLCLLTSNVQVIEQLVVVVYEEKKCFILFCSVKLKDNSCLFNIFVD